MFLDPNDVHAGDPKFGGLEAPHWRVSTYDPDKSPYRHDFRTCSYCGCIHPSDLMALVRDKGGRISPSTKGYKSYVVAPNPVAGQRVRIGSRHAPGEPEEIIYGEAPAELQQKIYWNHFTAEQRAELENG